MTDDSFRGKVRAVFLATIMVLSMVAMAATFAAPAGAVVPDETQSGDIPSQVWSGQEINVTEGSPDPSGIFNGADTITVQEVTDRDAGNITATNLEEQYSIETSGGTDFVEIDTEGFDSGDYVLQNGSGVPAADASGALDEYEFSVTPQNLDVEFDADDASGTGDVFSDNDENVSVELDSNRGAGSYNVTVFSDGLDYEELAALFDVRTNSSANSDGPGEGPSEVNDSANLPIDKIDDDYEGSFDRPGDNVEDLRNDDYITLNLSDFDQSSSKYDLENDEIPANFSNLEANTGIDAGDYELTFFATDANAAATTTISLGEEDATVDFGQDVYQQAAGDIVEFNATLENTDNAYVQFGDEDADFVDILYIEDDNDDNQVNFMVNTRLVGNDHTSLGSSDARAVYYSEDDIVQSLIHDGYFDGPVSDTKFGSGNLEDDFQFYDDSDSPVEDGDEFDGSITTSFNQYLDELDLINTGNGDDATDQLARPLQATSYDLAAAEDGVFIAEEGESQIDSEAGFATVTLQQPSIGEINTWVGSEADADDDEQVDELVNKLTQSDTVAIDDLFVAQVEATGIYGSLLAEYYNTTAQDFDPVEEDENLPAEVFRNVTADVSNGQVNEWEYEGIEFILEDQATTGNQQENVPIYADGDDSVNVLLDNENGQFFVVIDTSDEPFENDLEDGDRFEVSLEYQTDDDDRAEFLSDGPAVEANGDNPTDGDESYPYYEAGTTSSSSAEFTFEEPSVTFDNVNNGVVNIDPSEEAEISGETNVAPGSSASVRVSNRGDTQSFLRTEDVEIAEDGSFSVTLDFSDRAEGDEANVQFLVAGSSIDTQSGVFGEAEVTEPFTPSVSIDAPSTAAPGDEVTVDVTASNNGDETGSATWTATVDGEEVASQDTELEGGASETISETRTVPENASDGDTITIESSYGNASDSATVTVEAEDAGDDQADSEDSGTPGFGVAVAALALLSAALLARFRN